MLALWIWKEWREQRRVLLALALVVPLVALAAALFVNRGGDAGAFTSKVAAGAALAVVATVASELFSAEARHGTLDLIRRLPGGLVAAAGAKLALLGAALALLTLAGAVSACLALSLADGGPAGPLLFWGLPAAASWILPALALGCFTAAVSTWLPRGSLAIAGSGLFVLVLGLQFWLGHAMNPWWRPSGVESAVLLQGYLPLAALAVAIASVRGLRLRGGPGHAAALGAPLTLLACAPLWIFFEVRRADWNQVRPDDKDFEISTALVGAGARLAFVNARRAGAPGRPYPLVVDLATGDWRQVGDWTSSFKGLGSLMRSSASSWFAPGEHSLCVLESVRDGRILVQYVDGATGTIDEDEHDRFARPAALLPGIRAALRDTAPWRLVDGRRLWLFDGLEAESASGSGFGALPWIKGDVPLWMRGTGLGVRGRRDERDRELVYDPSRGASFVHERELRGAICRPGRWLVRERRFNGWRWRLVDPVTRVLADCPALFPGEEVGVVLDNGRVVACGGPPDAPWQHCVSIVDPETGDRRRVALPKQMSMLVSVREPGFGPMRTPGEGRVVQLGDSRWTMARLDVASASLRALSWWDPRGRLTPLACPDEDTLILHDGKRLLRAKWDGAEPEVLFPRPRLVALEARR